MLPRQVDDDGPFDEARVRDEPVPDEVRRSLLDPEPRPTERCEELRSCPRSLGREGREPLTVGREVGVLSQSRELPLELGDATLAVDPGVREVVARAHEVQGRAHERGFHDAPTSDARHELRGREPVEARPETDVRRRRPLRLKARDALDGVRDG